ncbi:MAG: hypothetical protein Q8J71_11390, partial [Brevundimonas sp.]|nr:hypothetical protein [Brevundimonas sp.]
MKRRGPILTGVTALALLASGGVLASALNDMPQDAVPIQDTTAALNRQTTAPAPPPIEPEPEAAPAPATPVAVAPPTPAPTIIIAEVEKEKGAEEMAVEAP